MKYEITVRKLYRSKDKIGTAVIRKVVGSEEEGAAVLRGALLEGFDAQAAANFEGQKHEAVPDAEVDKMFTTLKDIEDSGRNAMFNTIESIFKKPLRIRRGH